MSPGIPNPRWAFSPRYDTLGHLQLALSSRAQLVEHIRGVRPCARYLLRITLVNHTTPEGSYLLLSPQLMASEPQRKAVTCVNSRG